MSITWADVEALDDSLATTPASTQTLILAITSRQIDVDAWGEFADDGQLFLAAHLGRLYASGAGAGPIQSETLGPMSRSYANLSQTSGELSTTKWGLEYMRLLRIAVGPGALVVP